MPNANDIDQWVTTIEQRYKSYLKTSFYFKDQHLRESFSAALAGEGELTKGPISEVTPAFEKGASAQELAELYFPGRVDELAPALLDAPLYAHQVQSINAACGKDLNVVVATGTASGKTECFLYPILFDLYQQYLDGELSNPGVRAMVLYPMNALANDQLRRLGDICQTLKDASSGFQPTFGQYIGQTPENGRDNYRNAAQREEGRLVGELVFREEMRVNPPHILLTNYSMLEYLLIRPEDSPLFDDGGGTNWRFIVLDEAHQYRGTRGIEMGMLVRRLKQRLHEAGRTEDFRCIATSATLASGTGADSKNGVAEFAQELFGEPVTEQGVFFASLKSQQDSEPAHRNHAFMRALEGAFLVHENGKDSVVLNRSGTREEDGRPSEPLEIALCQECGQHYYVGKDSNGKITEAVRDPSQTDFGVEYYVPVQNGTGATHELCRRCGALSTTRSACGCGASISVKKCPPHKDNPDQLSKCETCDYQRGGIGDPVQEIVHGSDGPNAVIATALHELLPKDRRKVLAFADSRQEAAFFAWYAEDTYNKLRDRNLILRALNEYPVSGEGLSIDDLQSRLAKQWERANLFTGSDTAEARERCVLTAILREALSDERRLSLAGVGLVKWFVRLPDDLEIPDLLLRAPWNFDAAEARSLLQLLLDEFRIRFAMELPQTPTAPTWSELLPQRTQAAYSNSSPRQRKNVREWGGPQSAIVKHLLRRLLIGNGEWVGATSEKLMKEVWATIRDHDRSKQSDADSILLPGKENGSFRLNPRWLRIDLAGREDIWECNTCARVIVNNVRDVCLRNNCPGTLKVADQNGLSQNHYRVLYESDDLPAEFKTAEHTAQIDSDTARSRQESFKRQEIHLLSSSTTFEMGVDLGDLDVVFLRNVPPEPFNYTQRVGRAGRRDEPSLAITYCKRNPHDLYHFAEPEERVIKGQISPPRLRIRNEKIISRHMTAIALSAFFKAAGNRDRFSTVKDFIVDWENPQAMEDLKRFCKNNLTLKDSITGAVPESMWDAVGLSGDEWIEGIAGSDSRLDLAASEVCSDYLSMEEMRRDAFENHRGTSRIENRIKTIAGERTLNFLSRKAIIPKYGFPVDVVELDTRPDYSRAGVSLQRDLSQAIAEYAPGGKVVANKLEWKSCGVKTVSGKQFPVKSYSYTSALDFKQWDEGELSSDNTSAKYLQPIFGFVTPIFERPRQPQRRSERLYTTRPFFKGFDDPGADREIELYGVVVTEAMPGTLVILCEGKERRGFFVCLSCGTHMTSPKRAHKSPDKTGCNGTLGRYSLGHELVTDVVRMQFPDLTDEWEAYSLAYAIALGAAETLDVPDTDLNVTITGGNVAQQAAIVLYDNVPGGAGLVSQITEPDVFARMVANTRERVDGSCGCEKSCYGCLRSYRNQFAHPYLDRTQTLHFLDALPAK